MLKQLRISDFQCHDKLKVDFDPKITAIVGSSDVGKSAVLRALRWLAYNRPSGSAFIRDGSTGCKVGLKVDDSVVIREKGKTTNTYKLDKQKYEAFGKDVPEDIVNLLNMDATNHAGQHEPSFWFSLSPGEVAKRLNSIVDLSLVDEVLGDLNSKLRSRKTESEIIEGRLKGAESELEQLGHVPQMDEELGEVELLETKASNWKTLALRLKGFVDAGEKQIRWVKKSQRMAKQGREVEKIGDEANYISTSVSRLSKFIWDGVDYKRKVLESSKIAKGNQRLSELVLDAEIKSDGLSQLESLLSHAVEDREKVDVDIPDMNELENLRVTMADIGKRSVGLDIVLSGAEKCQQVSMGCRERWKRTKKELEEETGGICPVCERPWEKDDDCHTKTK